MLASLGLQAQFSQHLIWQEGLPGSQVLQPARIADSLPLGNHLQIDAGYLGGSNRLTANTIRKIDGFIETDAKNDIYDQLGDENLIVQRLGAGLTATLARPEGNWTLFVNMREQTGAETTDRETLGVLMFGNARYAGDTISDDQVNLRSELYSEWGFGTGWKTGKWKFGVRVKLLLGLRHQSVQNTSFALFTEPDGSELHVLADYDYLGTSGGGINGFGAGADLGIIYQATPDLTLQLSARDLGFISWKGEVARDQVGFSYAGEEVEDLLGNGIGGEFNFPDSLRNLLLPELSEGRRIRATAGVFQAGASYRIGQANQVALSVTWGMIPLAPSHRTPQIFGAYYRDINPFLRLGINGYWGDPDQFGAGLFFQGTVPMKSKSLRIFLASDDLLGLVAPDFGHGYNLQGGVILGL